MRTEEVRLDLITPYGLNPRNNIDAVPFVQKSIENYGYKVFIVVDANYVIVAGHTRWQALRNIHAATGEYQFITVIVADDLSEDQIKEFRIVDNQVGGIAEWDFQTLKIELENLPNFRLDDFGHIRGFDEIVIAPEAIEEPEIKEKKFQLKIGHEVWEWDEASYHAWASWIVEEFNVSPIDFAVKRMMIMEADREYPEKSDPI